jgi:hypothetical protein
MIKGKSLDRHHFVPKSQGGDANEWHWVHKVCHRKLHSLFTDKELAENYSTPQAIHAEPNMAKCERVWDQIIR